MNVRHAPTQKYIERDQMETPLSESASTFTQYGHTNEREMRKSVASSKTYKDLRLLKPILWHLIRVFNERAICSEDIFEKFEFIFGQPVVSQSMS